MTNGESLEYYPEGAGFSDEYAVHPLDAVLEADPDYHLADLSDNNQELDMHLEAALDLYRIPPIDMPTEFFSLPFS